MLDAANRALENRDPDRRILPISVVKVLVEFYGNDVISRTVRIANTIVTTEKDRRIEGAFRDLLEAANRATASTASETARISNGWAQILGRAKPCTTFSWVTPMDQHLPFPVMRAGAGAFWIAKSETGLSSPSRRFHDLSASA